LSEIAVTVVGTDRPGIVAAVTRVLYEHGCNLEDASSTILRGHFAMMLMITPPADLAPGDLEADLSRLGDEHELIISARPVPEVPAERVTPSHMISVYGADKPGIVFRVAEALADAGVNITELTSRVIGPDQEPVYALMLEVAAAKDADIEGLLSRLKAALGVDVSVHPIEADVL
jgi:glycine cleavage system transcriptional repressor